MTKRYSVNRRPRPCGSGLFAPCQRFIRLRSLLAILSIFVSASLAHADDGLVWRLKGRANNVYLLGSIHFLRQQDYPLPSTFETAYRDADVLVMELDMDDLDPLLARQLMLARGLATDGRNLRSMMGEGDYTEAKERIEALQLDLPFLDNMEPWFAALTLLNLQFPRIGLDARHGVEGWFSRKAAADGKEIIGLETLDGQLGLFDSMPDGAQSDFLLLTLRDAENLETDLRKLISGWKRGDLKLLEHELLAELRSVPGAYRRVIVERNRDWSATVSRLTSSDLDYLVIVGSLHLVGPDGLVSMLAERGYDVSRMPHVTSRED